MGIYLGSQSVSVYLGTSAVTVPGVYIGGLRVFPTGPSVPGAPLLIAATYDGTDTRIEVQAPPEEADSITGYKFYFDNVEATPVSVDGPDAVFEEDFTGSLAEVSAVNEAGEGPRSEPVTVTAAL